MWASLVVIAMLLLFIRVRICPEIVFQCPRCNQTAEGRRCYACRLEVEPDDTPSEMSIFEFLRFMTKDFIRAKIKRQALEWRPF
jgi:hypothetical protein